MNVISLEGRRAAAGKIVKSVKSARGARKRLHCLWLKDPEDGKLHCVWVKDDVQPARNRHAVG